jgi:hypothetical protein
VWESTVSGRQLHFHLAGINNQNFIMRDEETGSWWQQVSGEAIYGPLKGQKLRSVFCDEASFGVWKQEMPHGRVLLPNPDLDPHNYAPSDWEQRMMRVQVATSQPVDARLEPRTLVIGVVNGNVSRAYPFSALLKQSPIIDDLGATPIVLILAEDKKSVRVYERTVAGRRLEFFARADSSPVKLVDAETTTEWDFQGRGVAGPLKGKQLTRIPMLFDYWFDWKTYHPDTTIYELGSR